MGDFSQFLQAIFLLSLCGLSSFLENGSLNSVHALSTSNQQHRTSNNHPLTPDKGAAASPENAELLSALPTLPDWNFEQYQADKQGKVKARHFTTKRKNINNFEMRRRKPKNIPRLSDILEGKAELRYDETESKPLTRPNPKFSSNRKSRGIKIKATRQRTTRSPPAQPWRASFKSSRRTQGRIKKVFSDLSSQKDVPPGRRAQKVLEELLLARPENCNAVNLICALTYSAKAMGQERVHRNPDPNLRQALHQAFDILHDLVVVHRDEKLLSARQLCNACWAIAKHCDRDPTLLPASPKGIVQSTDTMLLQGDKPHAWEWNSVPLLEDENGNMGDIDNSSTHATRLEETIDEIAMQLTSILSESQDDDVDKHDNQSDGKQQLSSYQKPKIKIGEICMACWAYGKLRPRDTPPGWPGPPQVGMVTTVTKSTAQNIGIEDEMPVIKFKQLTSRSRPLGNGDSFNDFVTDVADDLEPADVTDTLFDAIGSAICNCSGNIYESRTSMLSGTLLEECTWSELANVGWAFASHGRCTSRESEMLLTSLADEAAYRLRAMGRIANDGNQRMVVRDITQLLWSLGSLQADNFRLADDLVNLVKALTENLRLGTKTGATFAQGRPLRRWSCADLVQVAVALAHARIDEQHLLRSIYEEGIHLLMEGSSPGDLPGDDRRSFHPWEASILLWAQARLHLTGQQAGEFDDFTDGAAKFFIKALRENYWSFSKSRIGPQEQANIAWSLVVLEKFHTVEAIQLLDLIFEEAARSCKEEKSIQLEHAHQLWQAYFILEEDCPEAVERVPDWFVTYLREKWSMEKARDKLSSARHRSLSDTLQLMGVDHINEHDEDIDVAIILQPNAAWVHQTEIGEESSESSGDEGKVLVAVEFDGPNHFTRIHDDADGSPPGPPRALGHTVLKYRLLKKQGWTVVRVPYYEFDKIPFWASMERQRYLQRKLKTHANIQFSQVDISEYKALTPNRRSRFD